MSSSDLDVASMDNEVLRRFIMLGLTPLQSQTYVVLSRLDSGSLDLLEEKLGAGQDVLQKALVEMEKKGIVRKKVRGDVETYTAVDPEIMVQKLVKNLEHKVDEARDSSRLLLIWLSGLKPYQGDVLYDTQVFKLLSGPQIFAKMLSLTNEATKEILRIGSPAGLQVNLKLGLFDAERSCVKRGVGVRAIIFEDEMLEEVVGEYRKIAEVKLIEPSAEALRLTIIDATAILFTSLPTTSPRKHTALWTKNRFMAEGLKHSFEDCWRSL